MVYSERDVGNRSIEKDYFKIVEYVHVGLQDKYQYYPLEEVSISFKDNASYDMESKLLFKPPQFDKKILYHIYNSNNALVAKLKNGSPLTKNEEKDLLKMPAAYLICYFNEFDASIDKLEETKEYLKFHSKKAYQSYKESIRVLRKVKYN